MNASDANPVEINILLLGDSEVGKSTFLSRLSASPSQPASTPLLILKDLLQPFTFDIRFGRVPFRLLFSDTSSPENYTLLQPQVLVLCYSIADRTTLTSLHSRWKHIVETHFNRDDNIPVIMLGLKRDLRAEGKKEVVFAQEAVGIAGAMRCDKYCECSAVTAELCREVFEDIAQTAAGTVREGGGQSSAPNCTAM